MQNDDPFRVWNGIRKDDPFAPHNGVDADNPFKPWNDPFGKEDDLTDSERRAYGLKPKYSSYDNNENDY